MTELKLTETQSVYVEHHDKKVRLILRNGAQELACRKESVSAVKRFLASAQTQLFKGRLQLHKHDDTLSIILKGEPIGQINKALFQKAVSTNL